MLPWIQISLKHTTHPSQRNILFHKPSSRYLKLQITKCLALGIWHSRELIFKLIIGKKNCVWLKHEIFNSVLHIRNPILFHTGNASVITWALHSNKMKRTGGLEIKYTIITADFSGGEGEWDRFGEWKRLSFIFTIHLKLYYHSLPGGLDLRALTLLNHWKLCQDRWIHRGLFTVREAVLKRPAARQNPVTFSTCWDKSIKWFGIKIKLHLTQWSLAGSLCRHV